MAVDPEKRRLVYACIFCTLEIAEDSIDPCIIVLTADWKHDASKPESKQLWQQWWCHLDCLLKAASPDMPEALRPDIKELMEKRGK